MRAVSTATNLSYAQIRYFIDQGIVAPKPVRRGQTREFSDLDLWVFDLAAAMRQKRVGIKAIKGFTKAAQDTFDRSEPFLMVTSGNEPGEKPIYGAVTVFWDGKSWDVRTGADAFDDLMQKAAKLLNNEGVLTRTLNFDENEEDL